MISLAQAAELVPVTPPTDWMGVAIVCVFAAILVAVVGYIVHIKRTPGQQLGEAQLDYIVDRLHAKQTQATVIVTTTDPLFYDGIQFASQADLAQYKAAKEIVELRKGKSI